MASTPENLYVTFVDVDRNLLKIWGQRNRIGATYIERQLLQLLPEFNRTKPPNPDQIYKGMFCFAKYTDDNYYRARVMSTVQNDSVGILFVDYGNRDFIKLSNIRMQKGTEGDVLAKMSEQAEEYYLARVAALPVGWTKEIISEVRRDVCYDEFLYQIVAQVGDQKILEIRFHNEDFSSYLVKKQLARPLSIPVQKQMILSYCCLVPSDLKQEGELRHMPKAMFSPPVLPPNVQPPFRPSNMVANEGIMHFKKTDNPVHFSQLPSSAQYDSPIHRNPSFQQILNQNIRKNSYMSTGNHPSKQMHVNAIPPQTVNPVLSPIMGSQFNPFQFAKGTADPFNGNNIIKILAQQVKQYIAEDNAKAEPEAERIPHHYLNSVLEIKNTYNVIISYIDDGPWSFSIQLLSSETELQKLMDELSASELVPLKSPIILGHPCIASSALYGNLCRGVVVSISHSAVKVYFVDFGNTEDLPSSSIYELPTKFFKIRVLSQKFCLCGLEKVAYSDDIKKFFKEAVQDELLMLRVTSLEGDNLPTCELYLKDKNIKRILNEKIRELRSSTLQNFPKVGDVENVVVTWVVSPQKFFVQLHARDADLNALKKELAEVEAKGQRLTYQQLSVGFKCVCLYEPDGRWYRAVITSVDSENAISVFYVDYGNTETVNISFLRRVQASELINQLNNQAIQCSLKGFENKPFDQALSHKLESLILEKDLQMTIVSSENELLCVQLFENGKDISAEVLAPSPSMLESLESSSLSRDDGSYFSANSSCRVTKEQEKGFELNRGESYEKKDITFNSDRVRSEDTRRDAKQKENNLNEQNQNWKPREFKRSKEIDTWDSNNNKFGGAKQEKGRKEWNDNLRLEKSRGFKQDRSLDDKKDNNFGEKKKFEDTRSGRERFDEKKTRGRDGKRFERSKGRDSSKGVGDDWKFEEARKKPIRKEDAVPPGSKYEKTVMSPGSCVKGIVTYYFSPHEFFVQSLAQEEEFKKMMKEIQIYYSDKYSIRDPVQAGDIVIAQFSLDKVLYRAEVVKPSPVTVRYVDYGNQEPVGAKSTWVVVKQFLDLPKQVFKCKLANIEPYGLDWPPPGSAVDNFFVKEYKCTFMSLEGDTYEVSLEDIETGKDLASEIIAAGLARPPAPKLNIPDTDFSLLPNQVLRLRISHVSSSSKFYVVLNPKALELIQNELKNFCEDKKNLIPINKCFIKKEMPCLCTTDSITWYRGKVLKVEGEKVLVWCCDRGDSIEVTPDRIMNLPNYLNAFQPQAVECSLAEEISFIESEDEFKNNIENKQFLVLIASSYGGSLSVVLYNEDGQKLDFQESYEYVQVIEPYGELPITSQGLPIVISHAPSPEEIYIQREADIKELKRLSEQISVLHSEGKEGFEGETEGILVAAKSVYYKTWYRGRLMSSTEEGLEIFYIDYGNTEVLPRENVKKLDPSFLRFDAFCRKFVLDLKFDPDKTEFIGRRFLELCSDKDLLGYFSNDKGEMIIDIGFDSQRITHLLQNDLSVKLPSNFVEIKTETDARPSGIQKSTDLKVFVSHVDSPKQFWVHKETAINDLHRFQDKLQKSCKNFKEKKELVAGDMVAVMYCDEWVRAKVTKIEGNNVTLQFVDYGNNYELNMGSNTVKELTEEFLTVPVFASPFALAGDWGEGATSKFVEIFEHSEDPVSVVILEESDVVVVDLYQNEQSITEIIKKRMEEDVDVCTVYITHCNTPEDFYVQRKNCTDYLKKLTEYLSDTSTFEIPSSVEENEIYAAKFPDDEAWYRARVEKVDGDEIEVNFIDYGKTSKVTEVKCLPGDLLEVPILAENCSLLYGETCDSWSEAACEKFTEFSDGRKLKMKVILNRIKRPIVKLFDGDKNISEELALLCENDGRSEVFVTHAVSPTDFYIRFVNDENYKSIVEKLGSGGEGEVLQKPQPGSLCQARFVDDGCWYRAEVLKNLDEGCEVFFTDFGNVSVSTELKTLPADIKMIPQTALRCSLNLQEINIPESGKEDFINLTQNESPLFRALIVASGDVNVVSLKLNGMIIEDTLSLEESGFFSEGSFPHDSETDDGKNSKIKQQDYVISNLEDELRTSVANETDEEKRVKIAINGMEEGFKSDDDKGTVLSSYINVTDNELMEEVQERGIISEESTEDSNALEILEEVSEGDDSTESFKTDVPEEPEMTSADQKTGKVNEVEGMKNESKKNGRNKVHNTVCGSMSRAKEEGTTQNDLSQSQKLVPGNMSRGVSLEMVSSNCELLEELPKGQMSQSAPNTPRLARRYDDYCKTDPNERLDPSAFQQAFR